MNRLQQIVSFPEVRILLPNQQVQNWIRDLHWDLIGQDFEVHHGGTQEKTVLPNHSYLDRI